MTLSILGSKEVPKRHQFGKKFSNPFWEMACPSVSEVPVHDCMQHEEYM